MNKYSKGKIYKIIADNTDKIYIGSTIMSLEKRFGIHKSQKDTNSKLLFDFPNTRIGLIELYPCDNKLDLHKRERYWIELEKDNCVNEKNPIRTEDEKKQCTQQKNRRYRLNNVEKIKADFFKYRQNNKEKFKEYDKKRVRNEILCECGSTTNTRYLKRHQRTKKHLDFINNKL